MKALYRKYRPTAISEVVGQEQVTTPLSNALKSGKISHSYLFAGPRGCGKTSVARIFAHEVNGFDYQIEDSYIDIIEIDAASNTGVDNIRELREKATIAPSQGKYKVYIIDEVHMLTKSAFNALLKTLEEPPKHVIFIMATTDAYKLPITITSRAQTYNFHLATPDVMLNHLKSIAKKENIAIDDAALQIIVERGGGSFRDSISLLDQISTLAGSPSDKITKKAVIDVLGLPESATEDQLLAAYQSGDIATITSVLKDTLNSGTKPEILAENLIKKIINRPEPTLLPLLEKLPEVKNPFPEAKILLAFIGNTAKMPAMVVNTPNPAPTAPKPEKAPEKPAEAPKSPEKPQNRPNFDKNAILDAVEAVNTALSSVLKRSRFQPTDTELLIITERSFDKTILEKPNNLQVLQKNLPAGLKIVIRDAKEVAASSGQFSEISDIMGGEVTEVRSDGVPF